MVQEAPSSISHHLIEELMVLANHIVAVQLMEASGGQQHVTHEAALPHALLRRHPDTEPKVRQKIFEILPETLCRQAPEEGSLSTLLSWCQERLPHVTYQAVCADVMTAFKEAEYIVADSEEEEDTAPTATVGHWALSLPAYMHFTSPIRRYADVLVHRRLAHIIALRSSAPGSDHSGNEATLAQGSLFEGTHVFGQLGF